MEGILKKVSDKTDSHSFRKTKLGHAYLFSCDRRRGAAFGIDNCVMFWQYFTTWLAATLEVLKDSFMTYEGFTCVRCTN